MGKHHAQRRGDSLVVVNPSILRSAAHGMQQKKEKKQNHKKRMMDKESSGGAKRVQKRHKKQHGDKAFVTNVAVSSTAKMCNKVNGASCSILCVKKDVDVLAGLYWVLVSRNTLRPCVVVLPNRDETSPAQLAGMFKHLGLQAVALHHKMTAGQRNKTLQRLKASVPALHAMVLVTTDHLLPGTTYAKADVVLVGAVSTVASQVAMAKFTHVHQVIATASGEKLLGSSNFQPELTAPGLQQVQARLKLARQIVDVVQRVGKTGTATQDNDEKWARRQAKGADLDDEDDDGPKKKHMRAKTPDEQRLQALTEKMYVVLTRKLPGIEANKASMSTDKEQEADSQHRREKLEVLGVVTINAAVGTAMTGERSSAQTRWMDFAEGRAHGGQWDGPVRHGASKDATSLALREKLCAHHATGSAKDSSYLSKWAPNKEPVDTEKWGGKFGKVCGHNEVVMNELRAFYPQEVLNSKVCSKLFPAPGNQGFDGCLELLRFACVSQSTSMTLWDTEYFIFISTRGCVKWSKKSQLLSLSLAGLQCLVPALRNWTAASDGHVPPNAVLRAIQLCSRLGCGDKRGNLPTKVFKRIMCFAFGGSARLWRQIAKVVTPLEEEIVYDSQ